MPTIFLGSDHAGYLMKNIIIDVLDNEEDIDIKDLGCFNLNKCNYPEFAFRVAKKVRETPNSFGVLLCGTGIGMSIAANKVKGIRCALCSNFTQVQMSRKHNDANILALGARNTTSDTLIPLIMAFINTEFDGGRHQIRVNMIDNMD